MLAIGGEDDGVEAVDVEGVAGMNDAAAVALDSLEVSGKVVAGDLGVLAVGTVVEEFADRHALDQLRHAAHVVSMEMGDEHMVDAVDAGIAHGGLDALGVAAVISGPAGIDQKRGL